ncbi:MAG: hypothetical protein KDD36_02010 [Flavobacteriales bacterium]|nr:hypothetical protein [Flavobacteriales bacterium]
MTELPFYISLLFGITVLISIAWFYMACRSREFLIIALLWTIIQSVLGITGVYEDAQTMPPRIMAFGVFPAILLIVVLLLSRRGKKWMDRLSLKTLTTFHTIRIPVEVVLALLYHHGMVSVYMTFEGTNLDIISGISALPVAILAFRAQTFNGKLFLAWNVLCLILLLNVVITAAFAIPTPFQRLAFDQPNIAVLYFPFNLLPTVVVPLVLLGHIVALKRWNKKL